MLRADNARSEADKFLQSVEEYPDGYFGRGIVTCGGGVTYGTCAYVLIRLLQQLGCDLPVEVWYLGAEEADPNWVELVSSLGVECVDAHEVRREHPHPRLGGWQCKPYAILHSKFREVLFLDADIVPVKNPTFLFASAQYLDTGSVFWPDQRYWELPPTSPVWDVFGVEYRAEPSQESGQVMIDKATAWKALRLCDWYNQHSDFYYQHVHGDKDTFRFAWRRTGHPISWIPTYPSDKVPFTLGQHDFDGQLLFQHRIHPKWSYYLRNSCTEGLVHGEECLAAVAELRQRWSPVVHLPQTVLHADHERMSTLVGKRFECQQVGVASWPLTLAAGHHVSEGRRMHFGFWWCENGALAFIGLDGRPTCRLQETEDGVWVGMSQRDHRLSIRLTPL
jgi:alpha 1,2-mannosyltransferase